MKRTWLKWILILPVAFYFSWAQGQYDVIIRGGYVVDGSGRAGFSADVAIQSGKIARIGQLSAATAARVIDAKGLVVAPGFIDLHTHSDATVLANGNAESQVRQGVTLVLLGEGGSVGPAGSEAALERLKEEMDTWELGPPDWTTIEGYFKRLMKGGSSVNVATYVSEGQLRRSVLGFEERAAKPEELEKMKELARKAMEEGAWGLVSAFPGGGYKQREEIMELAKVVHSHGGGYFSHIGSEGFELIEELEKAIQVAERTKIPVHVFHFKVRGKQLWGKIEEPISMIEKARSRGLKVTANQYPYTAMQHPVGNVFPDWVKRGPSEKFVANLKDPATRARIKQDPQFLAYVEEHGGWENIIASVIRSAENKRFEGKSIGEIARMRNVQDPADACMDFLSEEKNGWVNGVPVIDGGKHTGARPGQPVLGPGYKGTQ